MKNFRIQKDKKLWGVLGKQKEYYHPNQFVGERVPLNANPLDAWDTKRSRYKRVDLVPRNAANDEQQSGVPETSSSVPSVTPTPTVTSTSTNTPTPTQTNTQTPTNTATNTSTPTPTPSSTPYPLPATPSLWYDATNVGSIDYVTSGGTNYVANWRSIGTYQKTLSAATINNSPIWSGSTQMPGNPNIIRFQGVASVATAQILSQRFDSTLIPQSGGTTFIVFAAPSGSTYTNNTTNGFALTTRLFSGNTTTGGFDAGTLQNVFTTTMSLNSGTILYNKQGVANATSFAYTATNLNNKYLWAQTNPYPTGYVEFELNQSGFTNTALFTGNSVANNYNQITFGALYNSGGTFTNGINNIELGEYMFYNRVLSQGEIEAVQNYLRDKWRYDEWASPVPTPTPTDTPNPTTTPTNTSTPTSTPTPSPTRPASGTTEAQAYLTRVVQSGGTVDATASAATITLFTSLVSNNLWDKLYAFYPTLGGVAASHTINAKSSVGLYDLTFNGGWTHSSLGMQPNGTNGYAETGLNPSTVIGAGGTSSLGIYVNLQGTVGDRIYDMGVATSDSLSTNMWDITAKRTSGSGDQTLFDSGTLPNARVSTTVQASASGMTIGSVRSTTDRTLYRNGSNIATQTTSQTISYANRTQIIGAQKNEIPVAYYSSNRYAFVFMGAGLTNTDIVNLSSIINTYQTSLGRNTY